jgi:hypothetical protein
MTCLVRIRNLLIFQASPNYIRGVYDGTTVIEPVLRRGCIAIQKLFQNFFGKQGLATAPGVFDGRSDYVGFMNHGIPSGGTDFYPFR